MVTMPASTVEERIETARVQFASMLSIGVMGRDAFLSIAAAVGRLETINPLELIRGTQRENPHARTTMRYLCCLVGPQVADEDLPEVVRSIVCNPDLPWSLCREVVEGAADEIPGARLRLVAQALRAGYWQRDVADMCGVSHKTVERVSNFLEMPAAREELLAASALRHVAAGGTIDGFMKAESVGRHVAKRHLRAARETIASLAADGELDC